MQNSWKYYSDLSIGLNVAYTYTYIYKIEYIYLWGYREKYKVTSTQILNI